MSRRTGRVDYYRVGCWLLMGIALGAMGYDSAKAANDRKSNVLFLFTDDQRPDGVAALGNPRLKTPTLDSLAQRGLVFRNAYNLGSNSPAVCQPSRNMLLSGRAYFRWEGRLAPADQPNFPSALKNAGYFTYHHGKKGNTALLIQEQFEINKYVDEKQDRESGEPGKQIVDEAIAFLENKRDDRPFFMYLAFSHPHDPRIAAPRYLDEYSTESIPLPANYLPRHPFDNGEMIVRDELLAPWPRTPQVIRRHLHDYYAVITGLDYHIGRLLDTLKTLGIAEHTIVIFSSDNGLAVGSHGLMGKQSLYEHSAKIPLIIAGPDIRPGHSDALVYLLDLFPTVCDLTGVTVPPGLDGKSLKPVIQGRQEQVRDTLFLAYREVQRAVRDERWKLIRYPHINKTQLFDLREDPNEMRDLSEDPTQVQRVESLFARLGDWQKELGDTAPLTSPNPQNPTFTPPTDEELKAMGKPVPAR